jgi:hypothetical protein
MLGSLKLLRRTLLIAPPLALPLVAARAATGRVALVVGNGRYSGGIPALANPPSDATAVSSALRRLGFQTTLMIDATRAEMVSAMGRFAQGAAGKEAAVLFYAGHAAEIDGTNVLFPIDVSLAAGRDPSQQGVSFNDAVDALRGQAETTLFFLDSCRDNPFASAAPAPRRGREGARSGTRSLGRGLAPVRSSAGMLIAFATAPGDVALDGTGSNSPFTSALLSEIETPGIDVREMLGRVRRIVRQSTGGRQIPWDNSSLEQGFVFASLPSPSGLAQRPTRRTVVDAETRGIPLPAGITSRTFRRDAGAAIDLVGSWSSGANRYSGRGRQALLLVLSAPMGGEAEVISCVGPPQETSLSQAPATCRTYIGQVLSPRSLMFREPDGTERTLTRLMGQYARLTAVHPPDWPRRGAITTSIDVFRIE